jgi:processive 1,2-diacylglycerol beta-glucosyltransferase
VAAVVAANPPGEVAFQPARVLVLCADIGDGHVTVARALADDLRRRSDVGSVMLRTDLCVMGARLGPFLARGFDTHLGRIGWTYELAYRLFFERAGPRRAAHRALAALAGPALRRSVAVHQADIVVTEYPVLSAALGELRARGRLAVPVCSSISDPAGLYCWAHPGVDLHLLSWPESIGEVEQIAGPGSAVAVRPLIDRRFLAPPSWAGARAALSLPRSTRMIVVSGGGWGVGDLAGAVAVALAAAPDAIVVALAGRSEETRGRLASAYAAVDRVRVLGFTEQMPELLVAADVLIHTTGGTTALEARMLGCPLINYGTGPAHVRAHARALASLRLAWWAPDRAALAPALRQALSDGRRTPPSLDGLADAGELVAQLARRANQRAAPPSGSAAGRGEWPNSRRALSLEKNKGSRASLTSFGTSNRGSRRSGRITASAITAAAYTSVHGTPNRVGLRPTAASAIANASCSHKSSPPRM